MLSLACSCFDDGNGDGFDDVPNSTTANTTMSGTSMAAPVVSGVAALVLEEANTRNIAMSPAAMKALLIQTAQDVQGTGQATIGPDYATGWGIVDAEAAVNLLRFGLPTHGLPVPGLPQRSRGLVQGTIRAAKGFGDPPAWTQTFTVPAGLPEIHFTLAWDDPAGTPAGRILVNDLDLRLIAPDTTVFTPWILNPANPGQAAVRNGGNDAVNNVEQVSVLNPMEGVWTVRVSADRGNLRSVPPAQSFAVAGPRRPVPPSRREQAGLAGDEFDLACAFDPNCRLAELLPELIILRCEEIPCTFIDLIPTNCTIKYPCLPCGPGGMCPPFYHMFFEDLDPSIWDVTLYTGKGRPAEFRLVRTRTGLAVSFQPSKDLVIKEGIGDYFLAFTMKPGGKPGIYEVKTHLEMGESFLDEGR